MTNFKNTKSFSLNAILSAVFASGLLVACGGGGGSTAAAPGGTTPPIGGQATLVLTVPAATYTGEQAAAYTLINIQRSTCGFGLLAQNAALDAAATAHVAYFPSSITGEDPHAEVTGRVGFTGTTPTARALAKGYVGAAGEVAALGTGTSAVRLLLSGPYHLRGLMDGYRDIGIGVGVGAPIPEMNYFVGDLGIQTGVAPQLLAGTDVLTYPCNGVTGVNYLMRNESPNPVPGRDLNANPIGSPVLIKVRDGNALVIASATMVNVATGGSVLLRAPVSAATDPNRANGVSYFKASEAYVAPDAALAPGTTYQVTINGTNNGAVFSRTFSFTTGTGVN